MLEVFKRILYGNRFDMEPETKAKEEEAMAKAKANETINPTTAKEESTVKKAEGKSKATENKENKGEKTMQKAKTTTKATTKKSTKAKENKGMQKANGNEEMMKMLQEMTEILNDVKTEQVTFAKELKTMRTEIDEIKKGKSFEESKAKTTKGKSKETAKETKGKTTKETAKATGKGKKKSSSKGTATVEEKQTWAEKKAEYAKKFTDEEKAAYGFRKSLERKAQKFAYANTKFEERVPKKEWNKAYKTNLDLLKDATESIIDDGTVYTEMEIVIAFLESLSEMKKVRTDRKGFKKFVVA